MNKTYFSEKTHRNMFWMNKLNSMKLKGSYSLLVEVCYCYYAAFSAPICGLPFFSPMLLNRDLKRDFWGPKILDLSFLSPVCLVEPLSLLFSPAVLPSNPMLPSPISFSSSSPLANLKPLPLLRSERGVGSSVESVWVGLLIWCFPLSFLDLS